MTTSSIPPRIMIVDDDQVSVMSMQRQIRKADPAIPIDVAHDGQQALDMLSAELARIGRLPPVVVTLDLNMPRMSGLEFLGAVRDHPVLRRLVVFVFTTSDSERDVQAAFGLNAAGYVLKESGQERFVGGLRMLAQFAHSSRLPA